MHESIERLKHIQQRCLSGQPLGWEEAAWLGGSLQRFLNREVESLEDAFEVRFPQGGLPWWREEANRLRDRALRELAEQYFRGRSIYAKAKAIDALARRYASTAWSRDRERTQMPPTYEGTARACLWKAFRSGAVMPLGRRQLQNILA